MKLLKYLNVTFFLIFFLFGAFSILIISHEFYHYFSIEGEPIGICFGKCYLGKTYENSTINNSWAVSSISWSTTTKDLDLEKEEQKAWTFSLIFTFSLVLIVLICKWYEIKKNLS